MTDTEYEVRRSIRQALEDDLEQRRQTALARSREARQAGNAVEAEYYMGQTNGLSIALGKIADITAR